MQESLFDLPETVRNGTKVAVTAAIAEIREAAGGKLDAAKSVAAAAALALAQSIDAGAIKGRSTANEVAELTEQMRILIGDTEEAAEGLSAADRRFLEALSADPAAIRD